MNPIVDSWSRVRKNRKRLKKSPTYENALDLQISERRFLEIRKENIRLA